MPGSWTLLAFFLALVLLLVAACLWLTLQGSAGARARGLGVALGAASGGDSGGDSGGGEDTDRGSEAVA